MEIETAPHRPAATPWGRLLLLVVVFGPVVVLVLLPIGLGLQRYVMTGDSMQGGDGIDRGSVVFERAVPVSDLRVGDVITYRPPAAADVEGMVTHRIVAIDPRGITTRGDAMPTDDPWTLHPAGPTVPRVVVALPWVGWAYLLLLHPQTWVLAVASVLALVTLLVLRVGGPLRRRGPVLRERPLSGDETVAEPVTSIRGAEVNR